jgi:hypothetical protein
MIPQGVLKRSWKHRAENSLPTYAEHFTFSIELGKRRLTQIDRCPKKIIENRSCTVEYLSIFLSPGSFCCSIQFYGNKIK